MNHLTEDQLSALADQALAERERAACEAHLAGCEACRARLAELRALDESLAGALEHDPGEAYFERFADRVAARIADAAPGKARGAAAGGGSPWAWLLSPRGLSLVGGTAALIAVAGIAWVQFRSRDNVSHLVEPRAPWQVGAPRRAAEPRAGATRQESDAAPAPQPESRQEAAPEPARDAHDLPASDPVPPLVTEGVGKPSPPQLAAEQEKDKALAARALIAEPDRRQAAPAVPGRPAASPPAGSRDAMAKAQAPTSDDGRAREVQRNERGEDVPVGRAAAPPAPDASLAPAPLSPEEKRLAAPGQALRATRDALSPCGTVTDTEGRPVSGARVTVTNDGLRSARSGPDGRFCLPSLAAGDTLSILRVGYEPLRLVAGPEAPLALRLQPIGTLGADVKKSLDASPPTALVPPAPSSGLGTFASPTRAPAADVYARQPADVRLAVVQAREADALARREGTSLAYERAAEGWTRLASRVSGDAMLDARFHALASLRAAYRTEPTPARWDRLSAAIAAFVASAPRTLPERETAIRWQAELPARGGKALYR
jgi:hypothetical protein